MIIKQGLSDSHIQKIEKMLDRQQELERLCLDPVFDFAAYQKEYAALSHVISLYRQYQAMIQAIQASELLIEELGDLAREEVRSLTAQLKKVADELCECLMPRDPLDHSCVFLEIRAAAGGDEAAIFCSDLARMYVRYAESRKWQSCIIASQPSAHGGYTMVTLHLLGSDVYGDLKYESGAHRVQRVPITESQGRVHTSTCTVAVLPDVDIQEEIDIDPKDLEIDTFRASGAGGQHVNKTDSAIRIKHRPSGLVVECQEERSQHKNRAKAMKLLQAKLHQMQRETHQSEQARLRKSLVGTGDRSERIRTYNFSQERVTDHRIGMTLHALTRFLEGEMHDMIAALKTKDRKEMGYDAS